MKNKLLALVAVALLFSIGLSACKSQKKHRENEQRTVDLSATVNKLESLDESKVSKSEAKSTDNSIIRIVEETTIKKGGDTIETRRKTTDINNNKEKTNKKEKVSKKVLTIRTLTTTQIKEKQIITIVKKVSTGVPWWMYFLAGVPFAGAVLYIIRIKFF
ncbi:hypothetical protein ACFSJU_14765 [Paradesertivirga mongoliensis]|uniref:Lipoprotein n=1 Tax=Paradesertivirga mongoliensis TaxID=2100740 RepID=A0ABW4ZNJ2_9SPHI|nr:hypothetical protein [Pedobacter mongoliensis]